MIPITADQRGHRLRRGSRGGRSPAFDREAYKQRNTVERCINRLKQWRDNHAARRPTVAAAGTCRGARARLSGTTAGSRPGL
ncbi:hypothetical protein GCM10018966_069000 [Streptomyces yanii]